MSPGIITDPDNILAYIFGGKATVTLRSKSTLDRITYKVVRKKSDPEFAFVSILRGPDNENDYRFAFSIRKKRGGFVVYPSTKGCVTPDAKSYKAMEFLGKALMRDNAFMLSQIEVWHVGRCSRCGRKLSDPDSIARGIGPVCATR